MRVEGLWRYPVKSMQGEALTEIGVTVAGLEGDRVWAVVDPATGASLSAKRVAELLMCRAWTDGGAVRIGLPDGTEFAVDDDAAGAAMSAYLGRSVVLRPADGGTRARHEYPEDRETGQGDAFITEPRLTTFVDSAPVHLITTATLDALSDGDAAPDVARFRPNLLVASADDGFVENHWVGRTLVIGGVTLTARSRTPRCVITTRAQPGLGRDRDVLRRSFRRNDGDAGLGVEVVEPGAIQLGDEIALPD